MLGIGVILHASSSNFIQHFFDPLTAYADRAKYILGEFGIGFTVVVGLLVTYSWSRRAEIAPISGCRRPGLPSPHSGATIWSDAATS